MLDSKKKWTFAETPEDCAEWADGSAGLSPVMKSLLMQRGISSAEEAEQFLQPSRQKLHKPALFADMEKACDRVHRAISEGERILVYGDYDADGVTSTTVMLETLEELGAYCDYYIPNRFSEGYGPNEAAFREAHQAGVNLIITVDNGISGLHEAVVAKELGMDLIVTDHHEAQGELPDAYAILHPKCSADYPFDELAGVGVAFKFAEALLGYFPERFLDLVAIGTVADLVPLVGENRILVSEGLDILTRTERPGLNALKETAKIEGEVTEEEIGFLIGPRLNAVGRLQDADLAVDLLRAEDPEEAAELATAVQELNQERQKIVADIAKEAEAMLKERENLPGVIIVSKAGWNEGVLGIVASKLVRLFGRPAIVLAEKDGGMLKGSARSIPAFDLFEACMSIREMFEGFGGHAQAAGMTFAATNRDAIEQHLDKWIHERLDEDDFREELLIASKLQFDEINEQLVNEVGALRPFGMHNPKPMFHFTDIPKEKRLLGNMNKHMKLQFAQSGSALEGIGFGMGELAPLISPDTEVSVVGELGINEWNGHRKVQIVMKDLAVKSWQLFDCRGKNKRPDLAMAPADSLAIGSGSDMPAGFPQVESYEQALGYESTIEDLYLYKLPEDLDDLQKLVEQTKPGRLHACFELEDSCYLSGMPPRDAFKWLYGYVLKKKEVDLKKELAMFMKHKGWSKDWIIFMATVFRELEFIHIENSVITPLPNPSKRPLDASIAYQERVKKVEIEKTLYYSTYQELKNWFVENCNLAEKQAEREFVHEL
ncbi:single-stranded-DNA-specific exonuclease RecJ [Aciduricibacillus chroicocephali]|uniref:Single-stranded-DNA-specific exonuclease RecJ n=1 Tax=Aciduricibacillus chroicocephali TaxID=3054939 RepID=A0ABY9KV83_9BACI|nr:single-stranded-DNA-specific exonuclease RecJ [Bacillaceae bacterium 44XB]